MRVEGYGLSSGLARSGTVRQAEVGRGKACCGQAWRFREGTRDVVSDGYSGHTDDQRKRVEPHGLVQQVQSLEESRRHHEETIHTHREITLRDLRFLAEQLGVTLPSDQPDAPIAVSRRG